MTYIVFHAFYIFFVILESILFLYIISSWFPNSAKFRSLLLALLEPIFSPIRLCLKHSVMNNTSVDLTPMITLIILSYLQSLFYGLSM
ncbi:MAG: YggT family protein [Velocimicrobium sp.]